MANLEKVIKLTPAQYTTLEQGGTVGDYTGIDPNYLYLTEYDDSNVAKVNVNNYFTTDQNITGRLIATSNIQGNAFMGNTWYNSNGIISAAWSTRDFRIGTSSNKCTNISLYSTARPTINGSDIVIKDDFKITSDAYSDFPSPAVNTPFTQYLDKNNFGFVRTYGTIGNSWNAYNIDLYDKAGNHINLEYTCSGSTQEAPEATTWYFDPVTTNKVYLGVNSRRWKGLFTANFANISNPSYAKTATDVESEIAMVDLVDNANAPVSRLVSTIGQTFNATNLQVYNKSNNAYKRIRFVYYTDGKSEFMPATNREINLGRLGDREWTNAFIGNGVYSTYYANNNVTGRPSSMDFAHYYNTSSVTKGLIHIKYDVAAGTVTNKPASDGYVTTYMWDNSGSYDTQLFIPNSSSGNGGRPQLRFHNNASSWTAWSTLALYDDLPQILDLR